MVETTARAAVMPDGLRLLINRPGRGETRQWRVSPAHEVEPLPSLPFVAAGAVWCGKELVITGADAEGRPLAAGTAADGQVTWRVMIEGPIPIRWPIPGCVLQPLIAWQTAHGRLETAEAGPDGIRNQRTVNVGRPPLDLAIGAEAVWAVWPGASGIEGVVIRDREVLDIQVPARFPGSISVGADSAGAGLAWIQENKVFFAPIGLDGKSDTAPMALDLPRAAMCRPTAVPGPRPLVWASYAETNEGEEFRWSSAFVMPGERPLLVEGLVHQVEWWGDKVVLIGTREMRFLKMRK
jgi:hypothetical protein